MIKVVQVLGRLDRGGIETWLKDVIVNYDKNKFHIDFILMKEGNGAYDDIVKQYGSMLHIIPLSLGLFRFGLCLYKKLRSEKYDVVHAHPHFFCGFVCMIAFFARVQCRISHSHSDTLNTQRKSSILKKIYYELQRVLISLFSTRKIACSDDAGYALFRNKRYEIIYCGVDFGKFREKKNLIVRENILSQYQISPDAIVIGHVGRYSYPKNHTFLIDIFSEIVKQVPNSYLFLIGEGELKKNIELKVEKLHLDNVVFLGGRDDVNLFMKHIFDIFLFPSLYEGLGLVLLEAQAAGLRCLISDTIPREVNLINESVCEYPLDKNSKEWANELIKLLNSRKNISDENISSILEKSPFSINYSINSLQNLYISYGRDA